MITALVSVLFINMNTGTFSVGNMPVSSPYRLKSCIVEVRKRMGKVHHKMDCVTVSGRQVEWEVTGEFRI